MNSSLESTRRVTMVIEPYFGNGAYVVNPVLLLSHLPVILSDFGRETPTKRAVPNTPHQKHIKCQNKVRD